MEKINLNLKEINANVTFQKLGYEDWRNFRHKVAPIREDWEFLMLLDYQFYSGKDFGLAEIYTALYTLFGTHSPYDDYKCSFSYRFKLTIERGEKTFEYGLQLYDMKGNMPYFTFYRPVVEKEQANYYQQPNNEELSKADMQLCTLTFLSYLYGFIKGYKPYFNNNFYRINHAAYLIYGFEDGQFFHRYYYDDSSETPYEDFQDAIQKMKKQEQFDDEMSINY